jgi:hypothetical protein
LCAADSAKAWGRAVVMGPIKRGGKLPAAGVAVRVISRAGADTQHTVEVRTDSLGQFVACGLDRGSRVMVMATADSFYAPMRVLPLMDSAYALYTAILERAAPSPEASEDTTPRFTRTLVSMDSTRTSAIVSGVVRTGQGRPVSGARISIDTSSRITTMTDTAGQFTVTGLTAGVHTIVVRCVGFAPQYIGLDLQSTDEWKLSLVLTQTPVLEPVRVTAEQSELRRIGFYRRRETANTGLFITAEDLYWMNAHTITDVIPMVPYLKVKRWSADDPDIIVPNAPKDMRKVNCLAWYVDGLQRLPQGEPSFTEWLNKIIPADSISAMEIYPLHARKPYDLPFAARITECSIIVIWTKAYIARKEADRLRKD